MEHLTKTYGSHKANDEINLRVNTGEVVCIAGPNGAGKTTFVRQLVGLTKPTSGAIRLLGIDLVRNPNAIPNLVSYFGQEQIVLGSHTVHEAIYLTGLFRGLSRSVAREQTDRLIEMLGLQAVARRLMDRLSGGQKRMTGLGVAMIGDLPTMVLDEPTNALDPVNRKLFWEVVLRLNREQGKTILLVTHNLLEAEEVATRAIILTNGRIVREGTLGELKRQVDDRARISVVLNPGMVLDFLPVPEAAVTRVRANQWDIFCPRSVAGTALQAVLSHFGSAGVEDFKVSTASLEDVYLLAVV